eukprot:gene9264-1351_t
MTTEQQPTLQEDMKIEEIDDEIPELEDAPQKVQPLGGEQKGQTSRTEKKSRKAMQKLGLEPFNGVTSVQIKQAQIVFAIEQPEVYKMAHGDTFVIIGQAQVRDITKGIPGMGGEGMPQGDQLQGMLEQLKQMQAKEGSTEKAPVVEETKPTETKTEKVEEKVEAKVEAKVEDSDETGVDAKDIELVQAQVSDCTRAQIVAALKKNGNDVVNTIMELSGL